VVASPEISPSFLKRANIAPRLVELPFQKLNCPFVLAMIKRKLSVSGQATPEPISIVCAHPDLPGQHAVRQKQYHLIFVAIKSPRSSFDRKASALRVDEGQKGGSRYGQRDCWKRTGTSVDSVFRSTLLIHPDLGPFTYRTNHLTRDRSKRADEDGKRSRA